MPASLRMFRRDIMIFCFFSSMPFVGFWSGILYHRMDKIGTNTVALLSDTFVTVIFVCISSALTTAILLKRTYKGGVLPVLKTKEKFWGFFPDRPWAFGFVLGVYSSIGLTFFFDTTYEFFAWGSITMTQFVLVKMGYSGLLGSLVAGFAVHKMLSVRAAAQ